MTEQTVAGAAFVRIDVPRADGSGIATTQLYSPSAVYCITPTTEAIARAIAKQDQPAPVQRWELQLPAAPSDPNEDRPF